MHQVILQFLSTFPVVQLTEAYTGRHLGVGSLREDGSVTGQNTRLTKIEPAKIAEVRLRSSESPQVYYETNASIAFLRQTKSTEQNPA